jgi:hypothetical protein
VSSRLSEAMMAARSGFSGSMTIFRICITQAPINIMAISSLDRSPRITPNCLRRSQASTTRCCSRSMLIQMMPSKAVPCEPFIST